MGATVWLFWRVAVSFPVFCAFLNPYTATPIKIPMIAITIMSSIRVNPDCRRGWLLLLITVPQINLRFDQAVVPKTLADRSGILLQPLAVCHEPASRRDGTWSRLHFHMAMVASCM